MQLGGAYCNTPTWPSLQTNTPLLPPVCLRDECFTSHSKGIQVLEYLLVYLRKKLNATSSYLSFWFNESNKILLLFSQLNLPGVLRKSTGPRVGQPSVQTQALHKVAQRKGERPSWMVDLTQRNTMDVHEPHRALTQLSSQHRVHLLPDLWNRYTDTEQSTSDWL